MKTKKVIISILSVILVAYTAIAFLAFDKSESASILCNSSSYAEQFAKDNKVDYSVISDSEKETVSFENYEYSLENDFATITAYNGSSEKITLPEFIDGHTVIAVSENAFKNADSLKEIYVPDSIQYFYETKLPHEISVFCSKDSPTYAILKEASEKVVKNEAKKETTTNADTTNFVEYEMTKKSELPFEYNETDNGIEITAFKQYDSNIVVPSTVNGKKVTAISFPVLEENVRSVFIPDTVKTIESDFSTPRYNSDFFISLAVVLIGYIFAVVASMIAFKDSDNLERKVFGTPIVFTGLKYYAILAIVTAICLIAGIKAIVPAVVGIVFIALGAIELVKAKSAIQVVEEIDSKVKEKQIFMRTLTSEAEVLISKAESEALKTEVKKVYEAIRYSDPMTNDSLYAIEKEISNGFMVFKEAVISADVELAKSSGKNLIENIEERNLKCKLLK